MSGTHRLSPGLRKHNPPNCKLATNLLFASALAVIVCSLFSTRAFAQGSLPLGTMLVGDPVSCPPTMTSNWYTYTSNNTTYYMNCFAAQVSCPNTQNLSLTFGYLNPAGIVPGVTQPKGAVVFFNGSGGTTPGGSGYDDTYFRSGYAIVQMAWADDWEQTYDPFGSGTPLYGNIQNAGCRPATFLNYVYGGFFATVLSSNSQAGFCAQGTSAGSAQIVYSLAYYGAGSWLDNVELTSGPVFGDIKQGCEEPDAGPVVVCPSGQWGCQLGGGSSWTLGPTYLAGPAPSVAQWTNDPYCQNTYPVATPPASNARWLAQSIVDLGTGATPSYSYPATAVSAWLCRSVYNPSNYDCAAVNNKNSHFCPNNSSPQGQIFYANIGSTNSPPHYDVYAVDQCQGAEGVDGMNSNVPGFYPQDFGGTTQGGGTIQGMTAIQYDMIGYKNGQGVQILPPQCVRGH
jgi:hypothetical protein